MIILDTNVVSELMKPAPAPAVLHWMSAQPAGVLHVTTITYAEILFGLHVMSESRRKRQLVEQASNMFLEDFAGRMLAFEITAAPAYALIVGTRQQAGKTLDTVDGMIAAISHVHGATVATRDTDLTDCGIPVVDPWAA